MTENSCSSPNSSPISQAFFATGRAHKTGLITTLQCLGIIRIGWGDLQPLGCVPLGITRQRNVLERCKHTRFVALHVYNNHLKCLHVALRNGGDMSTLVCNTGTRRSTCQTLVIAPPVQLQFHTLLLQWKEGIQTP